MIKKDDFFGIAEEFSGSTLDTPIREFLSRVESALEKAEIPTANYRILRSPDGSTLMYQISERPNFSRFVNLNFDGLDEWEESKRLLEEIENTHDIEYTEENLKQIILEVFNPERDQFDIESSIESVKRTIVLDSQRRSPIELYALLTGISAPHQLILTNNISILPLDAIDEISRERMAGVSAGLEVPDELQWADSILRLDTRQSPELDAWNRKPLSDLEFLIQCLRLYGCANISSVEEFYNANSYGLYTTEVQPKEYGRDHRPRFTIHPIDTDKFQNLFSLLTPFYDFQNREFKHELAIAISHFDTALKNYSDYYTSITFAIIGLESLYSNYTAGETTANQVQYYISLLLGMVIDRFSPTSIKSELGNAFGTRNQIVHGDRGQDETNETHQEFILDLLRISIVTFAFLSESNQLDQNGVLDIESAMIDEQYRNSVCDKFKDFKILSYLPIIWRSDYQKVR